MNSDHSNVQMKRKQKRQPDSQQQESAVVPTKNLDKPLPTGYQPSSFDVICARGKHAKNHTGNRRFRHLIEMRLEEYRLADTKLKKSVIVSHIMDSIKETSPNHRGFVKMHNGRWYEASDLLAREKIGQCFRDRLHEEYKSSSKAKFSRRRKQTDTRKRNDAEMPQPASRLPSSDDGGGGVEEDDDRRLLPSGSSSQTSLQSRRTSSDVLGGREAQTLFTNATSSPLARMHNVDQSIFPGNTLNTSAYGATFPSAGNHMQRFGPQQSKRVGLPPEWDEAAMNLSPSRQDMGYEQHESAEYFSLPDQAMHSSFKATVDVRGPQHYRLSNIPERKIRAVSLQQPPQFEATTSLAARLTDAPNFPTNIHGTYNPEASDFMREKGEATIFRRAQAGGIKGHGELTIVERMNPSVPKEGGTASLEGPPPYDFLQQNRPQDLTSMALGSFDFSAASAATSPKTHSTEARAKSQSTSSDESPDIKRKF